jgi:hypothetical protein
MPALLLLCALLLTGCSSLGISIKDYGKIRPNSDVTAAFERYEINPDLVYYISGSESEPNVIIGLDRQYTLISDLWKHRTFAQPVPPGGIPEKGTLRYYVEGMETKASRYTMSLHGFDILDTHGKDIGDWYSILIAPTSVKMVGDHKVSILPPPLDLYERFDGEGGDGMPLRP